MAKKAVGGSPGSVSGANLLARVRELEQADLDVAARLALIAGLLRRVDAIRDQTRHAAAALAAIPLEREHAEQAEREAVAREQEARRELQDAELQVEQTKRSRRTGKEARENSERALRRAAVTAADAGAGVDRARERLEDIARGVTALEDDAERLVADAGGTAAEMAAVPRLSDSGRAAPGDSLGGIEEWGARAHAALFVVRGGLEAERERIVLEATALASAALGEDLTGVSVTLVRKRLEAVVR